MKSTTVNRQTGALVCPKCGASQFTEKRSVKGKVALGLLAPKRLKCLGCGELLKSGHGGGAAKAEPAPQVAPPGWYPEGDRKRYWNGKAWTEHYS